MALVGLPQGGPDSRDDRLPGTVDAAWASMVKNLATNTGKSLDQWVKDARSSGAAKHGELVKWLKSEKGLTHGYANLVATRALASGGGGPPAGDALIEAQYAGDKAQLRPIYERLLAATKQFGNDIEVSPKKTYVSLRRSKQFAIIQPSTATRVDVGINLGARKAMGRLENSGSFSAMVSHRVRVGTLGDVDRELVAWLKEAYENAA